MGNSPSQPQSQSQSRATTPTSASHGQHQGAAHTSSAHANVNPRRRQSIQALSTGIKASSTVQTTIVPARNLRAQTVTTPQPPIASQLVDTLKTSTSSQSDDRMGNEHSKQQKGHDAGARGKDWPPPSPQQAALQSQQQQQLTPPKLKPIPQPSPQTKPVDVPAVPREASQHASSIEPADASHEYSFIPPSQYSRPPRLPLPIEEEEQVPGSPVISPAEVTGPVELGEVDGVLPRRTGSVLSNTTADEEDLVDEFKGPQDEPTVPTVIAWEGPGERVYVTGTFVHWDRKYKLHKNGPSKKKDVLSTIVNMPAGTHHLKFIVDGEMTTSDKLPTAVDYTNILVNYLEVSLDDIPQPPGTTPQEPKKAEQVPVQDKIAPPGVYPPLTLPPTPELQPVSQPPAKHTPPHRGSSPSPRYHTKIPRYLTDLDAEEPSSRLTRATHATSNLPTPPSLPMFLSRSVLNGATPMKDDSSVLVLPNHTVLNHLATSSIKEGVLATSATTRYGAKFLTTIMYKPKNENPDGD